MKQTPEFWAAVRLVSFVNLRVTRKNWKTLSQFDLHDLGFTPESLKGSAMHARQMAREIGLPFKLATRPPPWPKGGELWRDFVAGICEYGHAPTRAALPEVIEKHITGLSGLAGRSRAEAVRRGNHAIASLYSPFEPWAPTARYECRSLIQVQRRTRRRLLLICTDADLTSFVRHLQRYRVPGQRLRAADPRGRFTKVSLFRLVAEDAGDTLEEQLDDLFVRTAVGGWWTRFYRCETCGRFRVDRLRRESPRRTPSRFCPRGTCRPTQWRKDQRAKRLQQRNEILAEIVALQHRGVRYPEEKARSKFELSRRDFDRLLRMRVPAGGYHGAIAPTNRA